MIEIRSRSAVWGERKKGAQPQWQRFRLRAKEIEKQVKRAVKVGSATPYLQPTQVLKRAVYGAVFDMLAKKQLEGLKVQLRRQTDVSFADNDNPFVWGFRLVDVASRIGIPPADRSKYATELQYAYKHKMPAGLVTCFLDQAGAFPLIRERVAQNHKEKWAVDLLSEVAWEA